MPGIKAYGLAQTVQRESDGVPGVVDISGDINYVGLDDIYPAIIYHKVNAVSVTRAARQGYGDEYSDLKNTYALVMVIYVDHKRACMTPDEMFLFLQANFPDAIKEQPYSAIRVQINTVNLNSGQVLTSEYPKSEFQIPANKSLFQITYTIETTFAKKCFAKCPEDKN
jgi:hypothetical protein